MADHQIPAPVGQVDLFGSVDCCCICRVKIVSALTAAHLHDNRRTPQGRRTVRLCWFCHHGLYDKDILTTEEVLEGHIATYGVAWRPIDVSALHRALERDLDTGRRRVNNQRQHGRTSEQSSANAHKAWKTRRARQAAR